MNDMVDIVPIGPGHIGSFHQTLDIVARERRYLAFFEAPPIETARAFVLENIKQGYPQFVAIVDREVVGWCDVTPKPHPIYAHAGVLGMGLLPQFRHQGIGTRLIRHALDAARAFGFSRVELAVRQNNENAIALYKKMGFVIEGFQRNAVKVDGAYENLILMGLLF
jgi:ribosomal protein S18 acetylase RimI-like enzyme